MIKIRCIALLVCLLFTAAAAQAAPIVLTFEDLRPSPYAGLSPTYAGLTWSGHYFGSGGTSGWAKAGYGPGCAGGPCSQDYLPESPYMAVFTNYGTITFPSPAVFAGAWFSSQSTLNLTFSFYRDIAMHDLVSSFTQTIEHTHPIVNEFVAGPGEPIRAMAISSPGTYWIMDDFTYTPVPEPASLGLMGLGLAAAVRAARRRR